ncbi:hypothetical protein WR25_13063 [Diploscapter pachys]|uniref:Ion transport domain-containing protein n=1 Tax=Diploscapter pachys TaxID=2018661 RepID=A0A2A2J2L3_9BILA|nr:hypothetical protein WR25_13063 [Diploscapter pachys]
MQWSVFLLSFCIRFASSFYQMEVEQFQSTQYDNDISAIISNAYHKGYWDFGEKCARTGNTRAFLSGAVVLDDNLESLLSCLMFHSRAKLMGPDDYKQEVWHTAKGCLDLDKFLNVTSSEHLIIVTMHDIQFCRGTVNETRQIDIWQYTFCRGCFSKCMANVSRIDDVNRIHLIANFLGYADCMVYFIGQFYSNWEVLANATSFGTLINYRYFIIFQSIRRNLSTAQIIYLVLSVVFFFFFAICLCCINICCAALLLQDYERHREELVLQLMEIEGLDDRRHHRLANRNTNAPVPNPNRAQQHNLSEYLQEQTTQSDAATSRSRSASEQSYYSATSTFSQKDEGREGKEGSKEGKERDSKKTGRRAEREADTRTNEFKPLLEQHEQPSAEI